MSLTNCTPGHSSAHWNCKFVIFHYCVNNSSSSVLSKISDRLSNIFGFITDHISGPDRALGRVCVCLSVLTITFEWNGIWPTYLSRSFILTLSGISSRSGSSVKVHDGHRRGKFTVRNTFSGMHACHEARQRYCRLKADRQRQVFFAFVNFSVLKWSVRPRVRAL